MDRTNQLLMIMLANQRIIMLALKDQSKNLIDFHKQIEVTEDIMEAGGYKLDTPIPLPSKK
jgi:hypothetical protein